MRVDGEMRSEKIQKQLEASQKDYNNTKYLT